MSYRRIRTIHNYIIVLVTILINMIYSESFGQTSLEGNTYSYITSESCKMKTDGGCWIVSYKVFEFDNDSVMIYDRIRGNCSPANNMYDRDHLNLKKYYWQKIDGEIKIDALDKLKLYIVEGNKLIGIMNNDGIKFELLVEVK